MLHVKIPIREQSELLGIVQATNFCNIPPELDALPALYARLKQKFMRYRNLDERIPAHALKLRQALLMGELKEAMPVSRVGAVNKIHRTFYQDMFSLNAKTATPQQTFGFEYFCVGTGNAPINPADIALGNEIYRRTPDTVAEDGASSIYATTLLSALQGNPTLNTTVTLTSISPFDVTVVSTAGAALNTVVQIVSGLNTYYGTISAFNAITLTLVNIIDAAGNSYPAGFPNPKPSSGDFVDAVHAEGGLITRSDATVSPGTGRILNRRIFLNPKRTGTIANSTLYDVIYAFVSIE